MDSFKTVSPLFLILLVVASCDTTSPPDESLRFAKAIPDTTLHRGESIAIDLKTIIPDSSNREITFTVEDDGPAADGYISGTTLAIDALQIGTATVFISARADRAVAVDDTFYVTVVCPTTPTPSEASYFPHEVGRKWRYDYEEYERGYTSSSEDYLAGTLIWTVTDITNECDRIEVEIQEVFNGTFSRTSYSAPELDTSYAVEWNKEIRASLEGELMTIDNFIEETSGPDSIQWLYPKATQERVSRDSTLICGFGGCTTLSYALEEQLGIVSWDYHSSHRYQHDQTITFVE